MSTATSGGSEDNWVFTSLEMAALSGIRILGQMACHSDVICRTLLGSTGSAGGGGAGGMEGRNDDPDVSVMEIDPSAPLIDVSILRLIEN